MPGGVLYYHRLSRVLLEHPRNAGCTVAVSGRGNKLAEERCDLLEGFQPYKLRK
jgi:hypothetical protein